MEALSSYVDESTSSSSGDGQVLWIGFVAAAISVVGFGSNFVPAKKIYCGNGIFYQFVFLLFSVPPQSEF